MKCIKKVITTLGLILFIIIMTLGITIVYKSYSEPNKIPSVFGWKPFIVLSDSMEDTIMPGDLILTKEIDALELKEGDVISFRTNKYTVITHRIINIVDEEGERKYYTKGDNNNSADRDPVCNDQIEGIYRYRIPKLGAIALNLQKPFGIVICIAFPLIIVLIAQFADYKRKEREAKEKEKEKRELEEKMEILEQQNKELMGKINTNEGRQ